MPMPSPVSAGFAVSLGRSIAALTDDAPDGRSSVKKHRNKTNDVRVEHYDRRTLQELKTNRD